MADIAPPPVVAGGIAPPPVVSGSGFDALGATNPELGGGGGGGGNKRKIHGTMVADASEAFAMLESMGISKGGGGAPPPPAAPPPVLPQGSASSFGGGGPIQPAMVTGGAVNLGATNADGGKAAPPVQRPEPNPLGMSQLGVPLPEARRDATIIYSPPSGKNTKMIVIVVVVLLLVFGLGAGLIAWLLSMDSGPPPPQSARPALQLERLAATETRGVSQDV